jgi:hypothetical protein
VNKFIWIVMAALVLASACKPSVKVDATAGQNEKYWAENLRQLRAGAEPVLRSKLDADGWRRPSALYEDQYCLPYSVSHETPEGFYHRRFLVCKFGEAGAIEVREITDPLSRFCDAGARDWDKVPERAIDEVCDWMDRYSKGLESKPSTEPWALRVMYPDAKQLPGDPT